MRAPNREIVIPAAIAALPLKANDKIVLSSIAENPKCRNGTLAKMVGASERYIKTVLRRLRSDGLIRQSGKGPARKLYLNFHVEQGRSCPIQDKTVPVKNGEPCAQSVEIVTSKTPTTALSKVHLSLADDFDQTMRAIAQITTTMDFFPQTVVRTLEPLIRRIETEMEDSPEKDEVLRELYARQGAFLAIGMAAELPKKFHRELDQKISRATPEQLVQFRHRVQAGQLDYRAPLLLTASL